MQQGRMDEVGVQGNQRRCLTNRAAAAAAAGHSGAQIAILKQAAVGARISVWWPLDEHWYRCAPGCIAWAPRGVGAGEGGGGWWQTGPRVTVGEAGARGGGGGRQGPGSLWER